MQKHYSRILEQAQAWAIDPRYPLHKRELAQVLAENSAALADGIFLDDPTWATFARFGCYVCGRLGEARCGEGEGPNPDCPLGFGRP